jgi:hypothetical protein
LENTRLALAVTTTIICGSIISGFISVSLLRLPMWFFGVDFVIGCIEAIGVLIYFYYKKEGNEKDVAYDEPEEDWKYT